MNIYRLEEIFSVQEKLLGCLRRDRRREDDSDSKE